MHKRFLPTFVGLLLIAAALLLTNYNFHEDASAGQSAEEIVEQMRATPPSCPTLTPESPSTEPTSDPNREMPVKTVDGREYVGTLSIPALSLELPVMKTWSYPNLKISPCRFSGTPYRDDMVIAAHNYQSHFGSLKNLTEGDTVSFTDVDGTVFSYRVALLETLAPNATEEMENGLWDLSLFTCTIGGEFRVTVRCERVEEDPQAS